MTTLDKHPSRTRAAVLVMAESGAGKTSALAALANAGYQLGILDFDEGTTILTSYVRPEFFKNVSTQALRDPTMMGATRIQDKNGQQKGLVYENRPQGTPEGFTKAINLLKDWRDGELNWGPVGTWDQKKVLVVDSGTFLNEAITNYMMFLNSGMTRWEAMGKSVGIMEGFMNLLTDSSIKCHLVMNFHYRVLEDQVSGNKKVLPSVVGTILPAKIGRYFNSLVTIKTINQGNKVILTQSEGFFELKTSAPLRVPSEIKMAFDKDGFPMGGLAELFRLLTSEEKK